MADIYSGAYVMISAASASLVEEGFLHVRKPSTIRKHIMPVQVLCTDGSKGWTYIYRPEHYSPKKEDNINTRGWTLQKYLLSPRQLIYGSWQARWVCRTMQQSDGGPDSVYPRSFERLASKLQSTRTSRDIWEEGAAVLEEDRTAKVRHCMKEMDDILNLWPTAVEEFTRRKLSVASDRGAAVYGIAKRYAMLSQSQYAAGLWWPYIADQLIWKRPSSYDVHRDAPRPIVRCLGREFPSTVQ